MALMAIEAILCEIDLLHGVGARLVQLADDHLPLAKGLMAVLVATRVIGDELSRI